MPGSRMPARCLVVSLVGIVLAVAGGVACQRGEGSNRAVGSSGPGMPHDALTPVIPAYAGSGDGAPPATSAAPTSFVVGSASVRVASSSASRPGTRPGSGCASDDDCRIERVFSCGEILSCQSSCPGAGMPVALGPHDPAPVEPKCGPQPPCTPACATPPPTPVLPGQAPVAPAGPRAACVRGRCVVVSR